jgi:AcrR family transcriptional regulator
MATGEGQSNGKNADLNDGGKISVRERNRRDKLERITAAARSLFVEKGFDETTTREIARRANVALGTLFLYATDKRDLLFLICTDELESLTDKAFGAVPENDLLIDELIHVFGVYYRYFAEQPGLSKYILRELTFFVSGVQGQRFQSNRHRVISQLVEHLQGARARGLLKQSADPKDVGWVVFAIYQAEIREWLIDPAPDPAEGLESLRRALNVALQGCAADIERPGS